MGPSTVMDGTMAAGAGIWLRRESEALMVRRVVCFHPSFLPVEEQLEDSEIAIISPCKMCMFCSVYISMCYTCVGKCFLFVKFPVLHILAVFLGRVFIHGADSCEFYIELLPVFFFASGIQTVAPAKYRIYPLTSTLAILGHHPIMLGGVGDLAL